MRINHFSKTNRWRLMFSRKKKRIIKASTLKKRIFLKTVKSKSKGLKFGTQTNWKISKNYIKNMSLSKITHKEVRKTTTQKNRRTRLNFSTLMDLKTKS